MQCSSCILTINNKSFSFSPLILLSFFQTISASSLLGVPRDLRSFGFSLSGGMDVDSNGYPDLVVGIALSDTVCEYGSCVDYVNSLDQQEKLYPLLVLTKTQFIIYRILKRICGKICLIGCNINLFFLQIAVFRSRPVIRLLAAHLTDSEYIEIDRKSGCPPRSQTWSVNLQFEKSRDNTIVD